MDDQRQLYSLLSTRSRRSLLRRSRRYGHPYQYRPRADLLARLAQATGRTTEQVEVALLDLRRDLLSKGF